MGLRAALSISLLLLGLAGSEWVLRDYRVRLEREAHDRVFTSAAGMRSRLESALNATVFLAQGLVAYVVGVGVPEEPQVSRALKALYDADERIRNVGLAPGNKLTFIYPVTGNERAFGLRFENRPDQWPSVKKAIETRQSVLAGPVKLVQGGEAIINRTPVFLADGSYWGVISTVIDLTRLLGGVGLGEEVSGVRYVLYGDNAGEQSAAVVLGRPGEADARDVRLGIEVPGGRWHLVAMPAAGWAGVTHEVFLLRALLWSLSLILAGFTHALLTGRATAREMAAALARLNAELHVTNRELYRLSRDDELTHLPNRRAFEEAYALAWRSAVRAGSAITVMMADVDRFKTINDSHGHAAGDATLVEVAAAIRGELRRGDDLVARFGGEEFVVMIAGQDAASIARLAENIRAAVARCRVPVQGETGLGAPVTISIGVATCTPSPQALRSVLIDAADHALYAAKNAGRDRVCFAAAADTEDRPVFA